MCKYKMPLHAHTTGTGLSLNIRIPRIAQSLITMPYIYVNACGPDGIHVMRTFVIGMWWFQGSHFLLISPTHQDMSLY